MEQLKFKSYGGVIKKLMKEKREEEKSLNRAYRLNDNVGIIISEQKIQRLSIAMQNLYEDFTSNRKAGAV